MVRDFFPMELIMVIELRGVHFGLKSYAWFQNRTNAQREFDLKSHVWFQTKITRHKVQLPLYYTHFEITGFFLPLQETQFLKKRNQKRSVTCQNSLVHKRKWLFFLPYIFLQSDWLVQVSHEIWLVSIISFSFWLAKKGCDLEQKIVQFGNKSHYWEPIRLQGSPVISKWV